MQRGRRDLVYGWFDRDLLHTIRGRVASIPPFCHTGGGGAQRKVYFSPPPRSGIHQGQAMFRGGAGGS